MTSSSIDILTLTVASLAEAVTTGQLIGFEAAPAGTDEPVLGVAKYDAEAGRPVAVVTSGLVEIRAATNIAAGERVFSDAFGQPTSVGTTNPIGFAVRGGGAGDMIAVILK